MGDQSPSSRRTGLTLTDALDQRASGGGLRGAIVVAPILAGVSLLAWALAHLLANSSLAVAEPGVKNIFYWLFAKNEAPFFLILAFSMVGTAFVVRRSHAAQLKLHAWPLRLRSLVIAVSFAVVVLAGIGYRTIMWSFPLSMDEYNAQFQSEIFAMGRMSVPVPSPWTAVASVITPGFVTYRPETRTWLSAYLPIYAGLRALALKLSIASMLNPLLAGLSVLLLASVARQIWPAEPGAPLAAVLLLAGSAQFLATSMTLYSMPAHLCVNLLWLGLYLKSEREAKRWPVALLPWIGVLALGLHNPFPHALFVAPFLLRMLRTRSRPVLLYVAAVYVVGCAVWLYWISLSMTPAAQAIAINLFGFPSAVDLLTQVMALGLLASWQTPIMIFGLGVMAANFKRIGQVPRDLMVGALVTFVFYAFFKSTQGHGWGYRYLYGVLGNLVLLAVLGLLMLSRRIGAAAVKGLLIASVALSVTLQWPLRAAQIRSFVKPFAAASRYIAEQEAAVVIVPATRVWYGPDLVRNGPVLGPHVIVAERPREQDAQRRWLASHAGGPVRVITPEELASFGLTVARGAE